MRGCWVAAIKKKLNICFHPQNPLKVRQNVQRASIKSSFFVVVGFFLGGGGFTGSLQNNREENIRGARA